AHRPPEQLSGATVHRQLGLERPDPQPGRSQLLTLGRAQTRQLAAVDLLLPPPAVDRLVADLQQPRHLGDRLPRRNQIERSPTELRRIPLPSHTTSLSRPPESRNRTLRNRVHGILTLGQLSGSTPEEQECR